MAGNKYIPLKEIDSILTKYCEGCSPSEACEFCRIGRIGAEIIHIQPADVKPIVYGQWIDQGLKYTRRTEFSPLEYYHDYECSNCHNTVNLKKDFCPNCGADMRK